MLSFSFSMNEQVSRCGFDRLYGFWYTSPNGTYMKGTAILGPVDFSELSVQPAIAAAMSTSFPCIYWKFNDFSWSSLRPLSDASQ